MVSFPSLPEVFLLYLCTGLRLDLSLKFNSNIMSFLNSFLVILAGSGLSFPVVLNLFCELFFCFVVLFLALELLPLIVYELLDDVISSS